MATQELSGADKTQRFRSWDGLAAVIAALVGGLALVVSGYTAYIQRQQVRAQVWPYLLVGNYDPEQAIGVLNKGVGPAIVRRIQVWVDGKPQRDWKRALAALGLPTNGIAVSTISGNVISAGERVIAIRIADEPAYRHFRSEMGARVGVEICFCSTLSECWLYSDRTPGARSTQTTVDRCPQVPATDAFSD